MLGDMKALIQTVFLADMPSAASEVARWLFREWDHKSPDGTLEGTILKLRSRCNVDRLPMALVAVVDGKPVGTASIVELEDPGGEYGPGFPASMSCHSIVDARLQRR